MSIPIGEKIRKIREGQGMGRQEFVDKTGIAKGTLIGVEQGRQEPKTGLLIAITKIWPEYAAYLLTDSVNIAQKNPEVKQLTQELPTLQKATTSH